MLSVPVNFPLFDKVLLLVYGRIKPSFYFSWVWAPLGLTAQLSSFSSSSRGLADYSKSQLVSSCCYLATSYSHKDFSTSLWHHLHDFVFSVLLEGMCWRGIVPSHTIVTRNTYCSHANLPFLLAGGEKGRDDNALWHYCVLTAPHPQCMKPCRGTH